MGIAHGDLLLVKPYGRVAIASRFDVRESLDRIQSRMAPGLQSYLGITTEQWPVSGKFRSGSFLPEPVLALVFIMLASLTAYTLVHARPLAYFISALTLLAAVMSLAVSVLERRRIEAFLMETLDGRVQVR